MDEPPPQAKVVSIPERVWGGLERPELLKVGGKQALVTRFNP